MTRKDYVAVANILQSYQDGMIDRFWFEDLVKDFADFFAKDNPNFSIEKFQNACDLISN